MRPGGFADDASLVEALVRGDPEAPNVLFERHAVHVRRVLARVLGADDELSDLLHDVFVRALDGIAQLDDPSTLKAWLTSIAVFTARGCIRRRARRRWLWFFAEVPEVEAVPASHEASEALLKTYAILEKLPVDERIAFALRYVDGMELTQVAAACRISLATVKRRISRAEALFLVRAKKEPSLADWLAEGRWSGK